MLPEQLSNHLCSLMPAVDRLCMVCDMQVSRAGRVTRSEFYPAVMRSAARLTYTRVAAALAGGDAAGQRDLEAVLPSLGCLHEVYQALRQHREERGALDFEAPEVKVILDAAGSVADIREFPRNNAHRLIEECMIAANVEAARFLKKHGLPALFRIHGRPDPERLIELQRFLAQRGLHLDLAGELEPARLAKALRQISGRPDAGVLENAIIRSLPQALYQPLNIGHFGLALAEYAHFTSPIRRYPDLLVHRVVGARRGTAGFQHTPRGVNCWDGCCARVRHEAAFGVAFLKCGSCARVGEFDAVDRRTGVRRLRALAGMQIDGLVHVTSLPRDYFRFHENDRTLVGERTGLRFSIGDALRVRLLRVDPAERKIDFELVDKTGTHHHPRRRTGRTKRKG